jgi:pimeloyl-ACP methyl ester carboxylesterase
MTGLPEQLGFETAYFDLPGARLHAALAGPAGAPLVVLLHGFPEFWYEWRHQLGPLAAAGFRVIAPDQRGYNLSSKAGPFDLQTLAGDIAHLIQQAGVESAHVVGHDWGGAVAWAFAAWHPARLQRLVVINLPHPLAMSAALRHFNLRQYLRSTYVAYFQLPRLPEWSLRRNNFALVRRGLCGSALPGAFGADDLAHLQAAWGQPGALTAMLGWYRAVAASWRQVSASQEAFRRIAAPALLLWGERDIALGVELAEASRPYIPNGRLVRYPDHTHWLPAEAPDELTRQLLAHLAAPTLPAN